MPAHGRPGWADAASPPADERCGMGGRGGATLSRGASAFLFAAGEASAEPSGPSDMRCCLFLRPRP